MAGSKKRTRSKSAPRSAKRRIKASRGYPGKMVIAPTMKATLRYTETISVNPGAGLPATYTMSANGLFDPNISGVGHQPRGFDQIMGLYERYTVTSSKITIYAAINDISGNNSLGVLSVIPANKSVVTLSGVDMLEEPLSKTSVFTTNGGTVQPYVTNYVSCKTFLGKKDLLDDDSVSGDATQNPADQVYWQISYGTTSPTIDLSGAQLFVIIEYNAVFSRPEVITSS